MAEQRAETRDLVWQVIHLIANDASALEIRTSGLFAQRAIKHRVRQLQHEASLIESILAFTERKSHND